MNTDNKLLLKITTLIVVLAAIISIFGMVLYKDSPTILQGEVECTQIKISGKLLGRIGKFYTEEGDMVKAGDTLVLINSPEADALMMSASAMKDAAAYESRKIDKGAREQVIATLREAWMAARSQADLAATTLERVERLYRDSVVTLQRRDEAAALAQTAQAAEKAALYQYEMAQEGSRQEDKNAAQALVDAAQGSLDEVKALLRDSRLTAPADGMISEIYPSEGELVMPGGSIMNLLVLDDIHVVLNIREDLLHHFSQGKKFKGKVPALDNKEMVFEVYYTSPMGSYATWQSSRQSGSYNLVTFKVKARPSGHSKEASQLRPGMSVIVHYNGK
ncbi:MAG: efflux RND transporter periplasmic adaptor subunit [Bacteroidales bacterium]|nr:efflux RND transporter periplasmic adaptor subunit [Bacteroidales bacterium]